MVRPGSSFAISLADFPASAASLNVLLSSEFHRTRDLFSDGLCMGWLAVFLGFDGIESNDSALFSGRAPGASGIESSEASAEKMGVTESRLLVVGLGSHESRHPAAHASFMLVSLCLRATPDAWMCFLLHSEMAQSFDQVQEIILGVSVRSVMCA